MGIRFACHVCGKQLNIKRDLAGRRGICPSCQSKFRIPINDAEKSSPVESPRSEKQPAEAATGGGTPVREVVAVSTTDLDESQANSKAPVVTANKHAESPEDMANEVAAHGDADHGHADHVDDAPATSKSRQHETSAPKSQTAAAAQTTLLDEDPDATWYVRPPSGGQYGPASSDILQNWIGEGRVASTALLWRDGWSQWREASEAFPELVEQLPTSDSSNSSDASKARTGWNVGGASNSPESPSSQLVGEARIVAERQSRSMRRVLIICILAALAATLIGVLVVVVNR